MDERINATPPVTSAQHLYKYNDNCINVIKSSKERTKTAFQELATDKDEDKQ